MTDLDILNSMKVGDNLEPQRKSRKNQEPESEDDSRYDDEDNGKGKKKYSVISQAVREKFIKRVLSKEVTIKEAAKEFGLKFSTSKAILQTYKKEGRIGKKKNRERKTKVINAIFLANINMSIPYSSSIAPINPVPDNKQTKIEALKSRVAEQPIQASQEQKNVPQQQNNFINDQSKNMSQFKKEPTPNDLFKEFIEKMNASKFQPNQMMPGLNLNQLGNISNNSFNSFGANNNPSTMGNLIQLSNPQHNLANNFMQNNGNLGNMGNMGNNFINLNPNSLNQTMFGPNQGMLGANQGMLGANQNMIGANQNILGANQGMLGSNQGMMNPSSQTINHNLLMNNGQNTMQNTNAISIPSLPVNIPTLNNAFLLQQPPVGMFGNDFNQPNALSQLGFQMSDAFGSVNQKRTLNQLDKDNIPDLELKNEQVSDVSVKRFKSNEEILWDFDYDKSKRELEDFIFRTHNAMKNPNPAPDNNNKPNFN